jgi:uncharacterized membrane protein YfcA
VSRSASAPGPGAASHALGQAGWRLAAVGVAAGFLGGLLGVGGGIIIVPGLIWAAGLSRHTATGTSLLAILPIAIVGTLIYALSPGGEFDPGAAAVLSAGSLAGGVMGSLVNARMSERGLRVAFAVVAGLFGARLVVPLGFGAPVDTIPLDAVTVVILVAIGLGGGLLSGLLGVGGSGIVIAILVLALDTSQVLAQGTALAAVIPTVIVAGLTHFRLGSLAPRPGLVVGLFGVLGTVPAVLAAIALPHEALRTAFGVFLLITCVRTLRAVYGRGRVPGP